MVLTVACGVGPDEEITATKPFADLIGARYTVIADNLYAYGVYESLNNRVVSYITLVPLEIGGPEFAFRRDLGRGTVIRIVSAWRRFPTGQSMVYYLVAVENSDLPQGIPIRLQLSRGNEGYGAELNPNIYLKLPESH